MTIKLNALITRETSSNSRFYLREKYNAFQERELFIPVAREGVQCT